MPRDESQGGPGIIEPLVCVVHISLDPATQIPGDPGPLGELLAGAVIDTLMRFVVPAGPKGWRRRCGAAVLRSEFVNAMSIAGCRIVSEIDGRMVAPAPR